MSTPAHEQYADLMIVVRKRFDLIRAIQLSPGDCFSRAENAAFHGRKIVEAMAFGCLVAVEKGLRKIPDDAKGQWNAKTIFQRLQSKGLGVFPSPCIIRDANEVERTNHPDVKATIEGQPALRLTPQELIELYDDLHKWLHEINPYVERGREVFLRKYEDRLWRHLERLEKFVERHTIAIAGEMMFCVLRDKNDGKTKVQPLSKIASLFPR